MFVSGRCEESCRSRSTKITKKNTRKQCFEKKKPRQWCFCATKRCFLSSPSSINQQSQNQNWKLKTAIGARSVDFDAQYSGEFAVVGNLRCVVGKLWSCVCVCVCVLMIRSFWEHCDVVCLIDSFLLIFDLLNWQSCNFRILRIFSVCLFVSISENKIVVF